MKENQKKERLKKFFDAIKESKLEAAKEILAENPSFLKEFDVHCFGGTALNIAVGRNDLPMVEFLLNFGADPNLKSDWKMGPWSALQLAIFHNHLEACELLISRGAEVDIHAAAGLGYSDKVKELVKENPARIKKPGGDGCHPLHFAKTPEIAEFLLSKGADIEARDLDHHSTPAQYSATRNPNVCNYLVDSGAEVDIFMASVTGNENVFHSLVEKNPEVIFERITGDRFPCPQKDIMHIYHFTIGSNATPLHAAASFNQIPIVKLLLEKGVDVNVPGAYDDCTSLHLCAWNDQSDTAKFLIASGADIERKSGQLHKNTPLGWAIVAGATKVVKLLLDSGAKLHNSHMDDAEYCAQGKFQENKKVDPQIYHTIIKLLREKAKN